ncbi:MAG: adenosine deaminase [Frankiaceae bacterium]|nr:adenosine deaminase [Frankiaceae bacterium]MBV9871637.1 adenosine deaminase [Frankiaceae bacterium]
MTGEVTDADLISLPKAHLHLHLTGGMRHATLIDLADRAGVQLPPRLVDDDPDTWQILGWPRFQRLYDGARGVLRTPEDFQRLIYEMAEDERAAGSRWLELQIAPTGYAVRLGDVVTATEVFCSAAAAAETATGVGVRLIIAANRTRPPWEAELLARIAVRFAAHGVVGFGLSNDERRGIPEEFAKAFRIARDGGLAAMPHAGELLGADSVARTIAALAPARIGHGVRAAEDADVMASLAERGIACEVCPASNVALGVAAGLAAVPIRTLEAAGVPVVLAADDPLLFGSGLVDQYRAARDDLGYTRADLARLARASATHSTMPADVAAAMLADIDGWERG